jgi:hypothetical protein
MTNHDVFRPQGFSLLASKLSAKAGDLKQLDGLITTAPSLESAVLTAEVTNFVHNWHVELWAIYNKLLDLSDGCQSVADTILSLGGEVGDQLVG